MLRDCFDCELFLIKDRKYVSGFPKAESFTDMPAANSKEKPKKGIAIWLVFIPYAQ